MKTATLQLIALALLRVLAYSITSEGSSNTQAPPGYTRFYSSTSFWNTPIPSNPVLDSNSSAIVSKAIAGYSSTSILNNTDSWGIAMALSTSTSKIYNIICTLYCMSPYSGPATLSFRIPTGAQITTGADHHLAVIDGNQELDMWGAAYNASTDTWSAAERRTNDLYGWGASCPQGTQCNGSVAAGFALLGGAIRPEEIAQGHIDHALSLVSPYTRAAYIACPATHTDGHNSDSAAIPEGAHVQLNPAFDVDAQSWPTWEKIIAKALQKYGAFISDSGATLAIRGVTDTNAGNKTWSSVSTPKGPSLSNLPWSQFRVLQIVPCNDRSSGYLL